MLVLRKRAPLLEQHFEIGARLRDRGAGLQPPDQVEAVAAAVVRKRAGIDRERPPDLDLLVVQVVPARHDADDAARDVVDRDLLADDRVAAAKRSLPELPRQNHDRLGVGDRVGRFEPPAGEWPHAQHLHDLGGDEAFDDARRRIDAEVDLVRSIGPDRRERVVVVAVLDELGQRDPELLEAQARELARDELELLRMRIPERTQDHGVQHAEDRRVRADAEREREDHDERERRLAAERPDRVPDVFSEVVHESLGESLNGHESIGIGARRHECGSGAAPERHGRRHRVRRNPDPCAHGAGRAESRPLPLDARDRRVLEIGSGHPPEVLRQEVGEHAIGAS